MNATGKKLLLINPANSYRKGYLLRRESRQVPLGLGNVAALTPDDWKVKIWDENFREFRFQEADLVGITAMTATVNRAYEIAAVYREKGIPVILGGIHASALPDEAQQYVDTIVIGEAEGSWPELIRDFESGQMKKRYKAPLTDLENLLPARHDLFHPAYIFASVQTSRGCPMDCDFCSVPFFNGHKYRLRNVDSVLDEIASVRNPLLYFVDDNIVGYNREAEEHAVKLFEGMIRRKLTKEWFAQASLNIADKPELLKLAARSGCRMLLIGIEAENTEALASSNKKINLKLGTGNYNKVFRALHHEGIVMLGAFIFGMETDTVDDIRRRTRYIKSSSIDVTQPSIMTPLPGTRLYEKMKVEDRLVCKTFPDDWQHFHFADVVFRPARMTPEQLTESVDTAYSQMVSMNYFRKRFLRTWWNTRSLRSAVWAWNSNLNYRSIAKERVRE